MKLNHLDLQVSDVQATAAHFEALFGLRRTSLNPQSPALVFLVDEDGFSLVLQRRKVPEQRYPQGFHLGFIVADEATVHATHARAVALGITTSAVLENGRGTLVYLRIEEDLVVEVSKPRVLQRG